MWSRKHPRLRGEDSMSTHSSSMVSETPPLARGRQILERTKSKTNGNTPACAGKTILILQDALNFRKHPRLRGEDQRVRTVLERELETPPLARGRPACTDQASLRGLKHPRLRGEDERGETSLATILGNTPACAGKTVRRGEQNGPHQKHPRLRGEDSDKTKAPSRFTEKHPRLRGEDCPRRLS